MSAKTNPLAVMERDQRDATKYRVANQHDFQPGERSRFHFESAEARAVVADLIDAARLAYKHASISDGGLTLSPESMAALSRTLHAIGEVP
jgi:hypothetical protein